MDLSDWFKGFENGIARLTQEQRSAFFSEYGKNCVKGGTLDIYRRLYEESGGDIDTFFMKADGLPGVRCEVWKRAGCTTFSFWNAPAACANKVMFPRLCCANVPVRVSFIHCKACLRIVSSASRSAIQFCRAHKIAR